MFTSKYFLIRRLEQSTMPVGVIRVAMVKATGRLALRRPTSTIPIQRASMVTKLIKINVIRKPSKSMEIFTRKCVKETRVEASTTRLTEIPKIIIIPNNAQAQGRLPLFIFL